jgi:hypothetical protein
VSKDKAQAVNKAGNEITELMKKAQQKDPHILNREPKTQSPQWE